MQDEPEPPKAEVKEEEAAVKADKDENKDEKKEESTKNEDHKEDTPEEIKDLKDIKNQTDAKPELEDTKNSETKPEPGNSSEKSSPTKPVAKDAKSAKMIAVEEYLVKFKNFSYLHCQWLTEQELTRGDKRINQKIKRFQQKREKSGNVLDFCEEEPFNPDYVEVDRVLDASEHTDEQTKVSLMENSHYKSIAKSKIPLVSHFTEQC